MTNTRTSYGLVTEIAALILSCAISVSNVMAAGPASREFDPAEQRDFRREARRSAIDYRAPGLLTDQAPSRAIEWTIIPGIAYTHGQDGSRTWNVPFELDAAWNARSTVVSLTSDGYANVRSDSGDANGLSDITLSVSQLLYKAGSDSFRGYAGIVAPTHGEVGSDDWKERLGLSYKHNLDDTWNFLASAKATIRNGQVPTQLGRTSLGLLLQATYIFPNVADSDLIGQLIQTYRKGTTPVSVVAVSYDFPFSKQLGGTFTVTRGLSDGARDTTIELDFSYPF